MKKINKIAADVELLKKELLTHEPEHFGKKDIIHSFFGSLVVGLTFIFKGLLIESSLRLNWVNVSIIVLTTILIITFEIYFIGYSRVKHKKKRKPLQFVIKRLIAVYLITLSVSLFLTIIFGISEYARNISELAKIILVLSMPCGIGAVISDLFKGEKSL